MEPKIIYEDDYLLVLDKPAGWVVNEVASAKKLPVIQTWLRGNFNYPAVNTTAIRSGVVHRLDKETSGILLVAKTKEVFENLQKQFKNREVKKTYTALVHGKVEPEEASGPGGPTARWGEIKVPVGRLPWRRDRFGVLPGGRQAETGYKVLVYYMLHFTYYTLLELYPKTGRTHQIRIHLKHLGHPIVSDEFYAGRKTARNDRKWCPRLFLHASEISFKHPNSGGKVSFKSEIPEELQVCFNRLQTFHFSF